MFFLRRNRASVLRRATSLAASLALVTMSIQVAPPVIAAPVVDAPPAQTQGPSAASQSAKALPTEVVSKRTTISDTYDNHDGSYTAQISPGPINYLPSGSKTYQPIDTTLSAISGKNGRVRAAKMATPVEVGSPDDASGFLSMDTGKGVIRMHLAPGVNPGKSGSKPSIKASQADVAGLMNNVDLRASVDNVGVHTYFILNSLPSTASFTLALDTDGLTPSLQADGSIHFVDSAGNAIADMPAPYATDSAIDPNRGSGATTYSVFYTLGKHGNQTLLTVSVDPAWLAAATYPVYVDPSVVSVTGSSLVTNNTVSAANYLQNYQDHINTPNHEFLVGYDGSSQWAAYLKFNLQGAGIPSAYVTSDTLTLLPYWAWYTTGETTYVSAVTTSWDPTTLYWNNAPFHSNPYSPTTITSFSSTRNSAKSFSLPLATVQDWAMHPSTNYGIYLYGTQNNTNGWKRFVDSQDTTGAQKPALSVTYTVPTIAPSTPAGNSWTNSRTLNWTYNPDGGPAQAGFIIEVATDSAFTEPTLYGSPYQSSPVSSYALPGSVVLTDGTTYYWHVMTTDGYYGTPWSATAQFRYDASLPPPPTFTAPATNPAGSSGSSYSFTWSAVSDPSNVAHYEVIPQYASLLSPGVCSSSWTAITGTQNTTALSFTLTGMVASTCYRLAAETRDNANNLSSAYSYSNPVILDPNTPAAPTITDNCAVIGSCYRTGNTIYYQPDAAKTITLTSTGVATSSGIASSTFGTLSSSTGWQYTPGVVPGNPAAMSLAWSASATNTVTLPISVANRVPTSSPATTITFVPDAGAKVGFGSPVSGPNAVAIAPNTDLIVSWTETAGLSPITSRSLQEWSVAANSDGSCPSSGWATVGSPSTATGSITVPAASFATGSTCYKWVQTLTDSLGAHQFTTATVYVDATPPVVSIAAPAAGQPLSGNVAITGVASDTYLVSYTLEYGAGTSPTTWFPITTAYQPVNATGLLGTWSPGSLTGVYSIRLKAIDQAGNTATTSPVVTVYLDNVDRGAESGTTAVPFDLDGGWGLSVNVATGEVSVSRALFSIPSYGPAASLSLAYNSAEPSANGHFGLGWSSNLTQYLSFDSSFVIWHEADGSRVDFGQVAGVWTALAGRHETLSSGSGTCGQAGSTCVVKLKDQSTLTFEGSGQGRLLAITDRFGKSVSMSWGTTSATATDASGRPTTIAIDSANGRITSVTDSANRTWAFGYTGTGSSSLLHTVTDPLGHVSTLGSNGSNLLTSMTRRWTPAGGSATDVTWSIGYGANQVTVTDPIAGASHPATFAYSPNAGTTTVTMPISATASAVTSYTYESHGWVSQMIDAAGYATNYTYYPASDPAYGELRTESRQVDQQATEWSTTTWTYDTAGNVLTETDPVQSETLNTYNATNDLLTTTKAYGTGVAFKTQYLYDTGGHLCREVANPTIDVSALTHPCTDALPASNADQNASKAYTYDANNELASMTDPLGRVTTYGYDTYGNQTSVTANYVSGHAADSVTNVVTGYGFDQATTAGKAGLRTSETNPLGVTTSYTYDDSGNQLTVAAPGDSWTPAARTVKSYDEFGAVYSTATNACLNLGASCSSWTTLGTTTTVLDVRGRTTSIATTDSTTTTTATTIYDWVGDAISETGTDDVTTTKTYDTLGRLSTETPITGTTTHSYDGLGDETSTVAPASNTTTRTTNRTFDLSGHLLTETKDATGSPAITTHIPDALGRDASVTDPAGLVTTTTFDGLGRATRSVAGTAITDRSYDRAGEETTTTTPYHSGDTLINRKMAYDALGRRCRSIENATIDLASLSNPCTDPITTDGLHNLVTSTYFDAAGSALATVDAQGTVTANTYDVRAHVAQAIANCTDSGTTPSSNPPACTGAGVHDTATNIVTTNVYSASGAKVSSTTISGTIKTTTNYDGSGRTTSSVVDPDNLHLETDYAYDSAGRQISVTSPAGVVSRTVYDANGRVCRAIANATVDPSGLVNPCYDPISVKTATANVDTQTWFDTAGNKTKELAANGLVTKYTYDPQGRISSQVTDAVDGQPTNAPGGVNATVTYYYDTAGRRIATASPTDAGSYTIARDFYDTSGRLTSEIANCTSSDTTPDANPAACTGQGTHDSSTNITTSYTYDAAGNKTSIAAPSPANGTSGTSTVTTIYSYDTANRLCRVVESAPSGVDPSSVTCYSSMSGSGPVTSYDYSPTGQLAHQYLPPPPGTMLAMVMVYGQMVDAGPRTTYAYDAQGRLVGQTDAAESNMTSWAYDANGNKVSETDPDGQGIHWYYDTAGALCARAALPAGATYSVPANPCTTVVSGATIDTLYGHDGAGNLTTATDALTGQTVGSIFDPLGRPTAVTSTAGPISDPGTIYTYGFSAATRTDQSGIYSFTLDTYGRQVALTDPLAHPNGHAFSWSYSPSGRLASTSAPTGSADGSTSDNTTAYAYDPLGRLVSASTNATVAGVSTPRASYSYAHNVAGDISSLATTIATASFNGTTTYGYDAESRLIAYTPPSTLEAQSYTWNGTPNRLSITIGSTTTNMMFDAASRPIADDAGGTYAHDKEGRITAIPGKTMVYDPLGRLSVVKSASTGLAISSYTYDPLDRLQTVTENGTTTAFLYVGLSNAVALQSVSGTSPTVTKYANDILGTELYEFDATNQVPTFLGRNAHGDVTWASDVSGSVAATAAYDPFGNLVGSTSISARRWQSSWQDTATGLYYVIARWYAPGLGQFLSSDPLSGNTANPQTRDPYAYAGGDSIDGIDPSGASFYYLVKHGDTLWSIARRYLGGGRNWAEIQSSSLIRVGQCLLIPATASYPNQCAGKSGSAPTPRRAPNPTPPPSQPPAAPAPSGSNLTFGKATGVGTGGNTFDTDLAPGYLHVRVFVGWDIFFENVSEFWGFVFAAPVVYTGASSNGQRSIGLSLTMQPKLVADNNSISSPVDIVGEFGYGLMHVPARTLSDYNHNGTLGERIDTECWFPTWVQGGCNPQPTSFDPGTAVTWQVSSSFQMNNGDLLIPYIWVHGRVKGSEPGGMDIWISGAQGSVSW